MAGKSTFIIKEQALLQKVKPISNTKGKIRYKAILQRLNKPSNNGLIYKTSVMRTGILRIKDFISRGSLVSEMDHPITENVARILNIFYKNTCQKILEVSINGDHIEGVCENTSNSVGQDLYNLITLDDIPIGFSLRAVASTKRVGQYKEAQDDIQIVTWDVVAKPSFSECILIQIKDNKVLNGVPLRESFMRLETINNDILMESCTGEQCFLKNKFDRNIYKIVKRIKNDYDILDKDLIPSIIYDKLKNEIKRRFF